MMPCYKHSFLCAAKFITYHDAKTGAFAGIVPCCDGCYPDKLREMRALPSVIVRAHGDVKVLGGKTFLVPTLEGSCS